MLYFNATEHLLRCEKYYSNPNRIYDDLEEQAIRSAALQNFYPFLIKPDFELGFGVYQIPILPESQMIDILNNSSNFKLEIIQNTKDSILAYVRTISQRDKLEVIAQHFFIGSNFTVSFEIDIDLNKNSITINDAYVSEKGDNSPYNSIFSSMIGVVL